MQMIFRIFRMRTQKYEITRDKNKTNLKYVVEVALAPF